MKKAYWFLIVSVLCLYIGTLFISMHWPFGKIIFSISCVVLIFSLLLFLVVRLRKAEYLFKRVIDTVVVLGWTYSLLLIFLHFEMRTIDIKDWFIIPSYYFLSIFLIQQLIESFLIKEQSSIKIKTFIFLLIPTVFSWVGF